MKQIIVVILLAISLPAVAQVKSASLTASGLTCSMCSRAIFKSLEKIPFVQKVDANVETSVFTIHFKPGSEVEPDAIKKAVEDAGFSVAELKITADFNNTEVTDDAHITLSGMRYHFVHVGRHTLNGNQTLTLLDKNFAPARQHKEYARYTTMSCYETGKPLPCCQQGDAAAKRVYHVTL